MADEAERFMDVVHDLSAQVAGNFGRLQDLPSQLMMKVVYRVEASPVAALIVCNRLAGSDREAIHSGDTEVQRDCRVFRETMN